MKNEPSIFTVLGWTTEQLANHLVRTGRGVRVIMDICARMGITASFKSEPPHGLEFVHEHRWVQRIGDNFRECVGCRVRESLCTICSQPIEGGSVVGDGDGSMAGGGRFAHKTCYDIRKSRSLL